MRLAFAFVLLFAAAPLSAQTIPASRFTLDRPKSVADVLTLVEKQTGIKVRTGPLDSNAIVDANNSTFWELLESMATKSGTRLTVNGANKTISFDKGPARTAASLDGAFRIAANAVTARADATTGETAYTLALDVQWEPRFPVFRIDSQPKIAAAKDDRGTSLRVNTAAVKSAASGYAHATELRVDGLTRKATRIAAIAGEFTVTAAPKMLVFEFDDLVKLPATKEIDGVKATLAKVLKRDAVWELQLTVGYPSDPPSFESFESWTNRNEIRLLAPNGRAAEGIENQDVVSTGRTIQAAYRYAFKTADLSDRTGWKVLYETPAPLVEFPVKFSLKDIPLP